MIFILSVYVRQNEIKANFSTNGESWVVLSNIEQSIKTKIESAGIPLKDWDINIYRGVLTGYNEAFIINGETKDRLISEDPKSAEIVRPLLRGRDIKRYTYEFADLYLITTFPSLNIDIEQYPAIKAHLLSFGYDRLKQTGDKGSRKKTNNKWFETQDSIGYWEDFYKQKVVWKRVGSILRFSYDESSLIALDSTCFATGNYIKYITAYLNSKIGNYLLQDSPQTGTGDLLISVQAIEPILAPLPSERINLEVESIIDQLVNSSVDKKGRDFLEEKINSIIYKQLKLDNEEVKFIDSL